MIIARNHNNPGLYMLNIKMRANSLFLKISKKYYLNVNFQEVKENK